MKPHPTHHHKLRYTILHSFIGGISWMLGLTLGFSLLVFLLSLIMRMIGGLPLIGEWLADLVEVTLNALNRR